MYEERADGGNDEAFSPEPDHFAGEEGEWYFDLPKGAWERQEEKNRSLRESVRGNIKRQDDVDTAAAKRDPFRKKPGAFTFRDRDPEEGAAGSWGAAPETAPETPSATWGAALGDSKPAGPAGWGEPSPAAAREEHIAPPPPVQPAVQPLAFRRNRTEDDGATRSEPEARWDTPAEDAAAPTLDGDVSLVDAMRSWATGTRPAQAAQPPAARPALMAQPPAARTLPEAQPPAARRAGPEAKPADEASPPAPAVPALKLVRHRHDDAPEADKKPTGDEPHSKFDEMFALPADGGGLVDSMREWAAGPALTAERELPTDISELPAEFLKPFDWELEGTAEAGRGPDLALEMPSSALDEETVGQMNADAADAWQDPEPQPVPSVPDALTLGGWGAVEALPAEGPDLAKAAWEGIDAALNDREGPGQDGRPAVAVEADEPRPRRGLLSKIFGRREAVEEPAAAFEPGAAGSWAIDEDGPGGTFAGPATGETGDIQQAPWAEVPVQAAWPAPVAAAPAVEVEPAAIAARVEQADAEDEQRLRAAMAEWAARGAGREARLPSPADSEHATLHAGSMPVDEPHNDDPWKEVDAAESGAGGGHLEWAVNEAPPERTAIQPPSHWPPGQESARQELDDDDPWASFMAEQETEEPLPFGSPATVTPGAPVSWATSAPGPENDEHSAVRPAAAPAGGATRHAFVEGDAEQDAPLTRDLWARAFSAANSPAAARQPGPDEVAPPAAPLEPAPSGASDADADEPDAPLTRDLFARAFSAADRAGEVEQPAAEMDPPAAVLEPEPPAFEAEEGDDLDAPLTRDLWKRAFSAADGPGEVEQPAAEIDPPAAALEPEPPAFEAEEGDEFDAPLTRDLFARAFSAADRAEEVEQPDPDEAAPPLARPAWDPATLWARTSPNHGPSRAAANLPPPPAWEPEDDTASPAGPHRATDGYAVSRQWEDREPGPVAEVTTEDDPWAAIVAASGYDDRGPDAASVYLGKRPEAKSEEPTAAPIVTRYPEPAAPEPAAWADEAPAPPAPALDIPRWAEAESDDDTLLRAFEAHASQAVEDDPEPADDAAMEAFEPLFGKLAAELVNETESIAISSRTQAASWTPPSARLTPSDSMAASSPFGPAAPPPGWSDAGRAGFDDTFPLPGAFAGFGEDELAVPAANANRGRTLIRELVETGLLALLVFLAVRASFQNFKVDGSSMFPTLKDGQFLIVNKLVYSEVDVDKMSRFLPFLDPGAEPKRHVFHAPDRGDIIVLIDPKKPDTDLIKRVVGLPGETVEIVDGRVYIDGFLLDEPYIKTPWHDNRPKVAIPEGQYFVMGDNRDNSLDSRSSQVGLIPKDLIIGKALLSYWPKAQFGPAPNGSPKITDTPLPSIAIPTEEPQKAAAGR